MDKEKELFPQSEEIYKTLLNSIVKARKRKNYTQKYIAEQCNIPISSYSEYERGNQSFPIDKFIRVVLFLEIDLFNLDFRSVGDYLKILTDNDASFKEDLQKIKAQLDFLTQHISGSPDDQPGTPPPSW
ncbi:MAG: helix-turn-helix transcriptional regulator [Bacteroidia bacterium]|nr:helix-turn-helix transcriptional regulator [Bacteroidia bacterium]